MGGICGGYSNEQPFITFVTEMLFKLKHCGDNGVGIATLENGIFHVKKAPYDVEKFLSNEDLSDILGNVGICHIRFATHGRPAFENTHPHFDCKKTIAVVMDGIVKDYEIHVKKLREQGHVFESRCDAEILSHIAEELENKPLISIGKAILSTVQGYYSAAFLFKDGNILIVRNGPEVYIGKGKNGVFFASEPDAIAKCVDEFFLVPNRSYLIVKKDELRAFDYNGKPIRVNFLKEVPMKSVPQGFPHFMLKEIKEIPDALSRAIIVHQRRYLEIIAQMIRNARSVYITGCGSSYFAGMIGAYMLTEMGGIAPITISATEFRFYALKDIKPGDVIIAISQSGKTTDVIRTINDAKLRGAVLIGIINELGSPLMYASNAYLPVGCGKENSIPATKSFVCTLITLGKIALALACQRNISVEVDEKEMNKIPTLAKITIDHVESKCIAIAKELAKSNIAFVLSRGILFPLALEGALKLKEAARIFAEGLSAGELRHGPISLIDRGVPTIFILPTEEDAMQDTYVLMEEAASENAMVIAITHEHDKTAEKITPHVIKVPYTQSKWIQVILRVIPLQFLAYYAGTIRGVNPDKPKKLKKYVVL